MSHVDSKYLKKREERTRRVAEKRLGKLEYSLKNEAR